MDSPQELIKLQDINFRYTGQSANGRNLFNRLNVSINCGEYLAISGTNGSGKTTLAALIKGMLTPLSGNIFFQNRDVAGSGINPEIGYIFSNAENQIVSPVVEDDIAFGLENIGIDGKSIESAVIAALEKVKSLELRKELTHLLSGGEQQKVNIAGILALECKCIIFDEASSMLDPGSRRALLKILKNLNKEYGITIIQITHNFFELMNSDRILYLRDGKILFDGQLPDLINCENVYMSFAEKQQNLVGFYQDLCKFISEPFELDSDVSRVVNRLYCRLKG